MKKYFFTSDRLSGFVHFGEIKIFSFKPLDKEAFKLYNFFINDKFFRRFYMKSAAELRELNKGRFIDQVCYVTDDYMRTIRYFTEMLEMGPWTIIENTEESAYDVKLNGEPLTEPW